MFFFCPRLPSGIEECLAHQLYRWGILCLRHCTLPCSELQAFWHLGFEGFQTWGSWFWPVCTFCLASCPEDGQQWLPAMWWVKKGRSRAFLFLRCMTLGWWCYCVDSILLPGLWFWGWCQGFCIRTWPRDPCVSSPEEAFMGGRMSWQAVWDGIRYFSKCKV